MNTSFSVNERVWFFYCKSHINITCSVNIYVPKSGLLDHIYLHSYCIVSLLCVLSYVKWLQKNMLCAKNANIN